MMKKKKVFIILLVILAIIILAGIVYAATGNLSKKDGVAVSTIAKFDGIAKSLISKIDGVLIALVGNDAYTKLLLHMEGTDDAQVFTDSSVGNLVKVDAGTGFSDAFGAFNSAYLSIADHADWSFGSGDFTIETWWMYLGGDSTQVIASQGDDAVGGDTFEFYFRMSANTLQFKYSTDGTDGTGAAFSDNWTPTKGVWYHLAVCRNGSDLRMFVDGVQTGSTNNISSDTLYSSADPLLVGARFYTGQGYIQKNTANMDELRISNVARYTTAFTPPTSNFTSDANTKLLLHMDLPNADPQSFVDSGNTGHTVTANGNVYQKARNLGIIGTSAGYFDGASDLNIADSADWDFGSGDFTIEGWIYPHDISTKNFVIVEQYDDNSNRWSLRAQNNGEKINFVADSAGTSIDVTIEVSHGMIVNTWNHAAIVRNGNVFTVYINGVSVGSDTDTNDMPDLTDGIIVGGDGAGMMDGYIEDLRIVKGTAVYTANFNPPTTALTDITNTKLLLHFDAGEGVVAVTDSSSSNHTANITENGNFIQVIGHGADAEGNVKTENTQKKFGTTSAYFDGTGDYIFLGTGSDFDFGSDDFTVDLWVYITASPDDYTGIVGAVGTGGWGILMMADDDSYVRWGDHGDVRGDPITKNQWVHLAMVRDGDTGRFFVDGTQEYTADLTGDIINMATDVEGLHVGTNSNTPTLEITGYIDELRISKGIARWTSNFTPPTRVYEQ